MTIPSFKYLIFVWAVCLLYYLLPRRFRKGVLLLSCYGFYCCFSAVGALLLAGCTLAVYLCAIALERKLWGKTRLWQWLGLGLPLASLFIFKYLDFALGSLLFLFGKSTAPLGLLLPLGISFYTLTAVGYICDVADGEVKAEHDPVDLFLFLSFFPSLLSGPINRAKALLPQLKEPAQFKLENVKQGILRFALGAAKKLALADLLGLYVNYVYGDLSSCSGGAMLLAALMYASQIYFDFAGYSDMAIGVAQILGVTLPENFRAPYLSDSVRLFWQRWHISMTSWLRDHIYFPMGGSRGSRVRTSVNILIVFAVSGLWHGSSWCFVLWGLLNGFYQVIGRLTYSPRQRFWRRCGVDDSALWLRLLRVAGVYILVALAFVFFRADSFSSAVTLLRGVSLIPVEGFGATALRAQLGIRRALVAAFSITVFTVDDGLRLTRGRGLFSGLEQRQYLFWLVTAAVTAYVLMFGVYGSGFDAQSFVYFQF